MPRRGRQIPSAGRRKGEANKLRGSARGSAGPAGTESFDDAEFAGSQPEIRLPNGLNLRLRRLHRRDRSRLKEFFARCSAEAIRYRFMSSINPASGSLLNYLAEPDGSRHVALIVTKGLGKSERVVAEGRFVVFNERRDTADVALLVVDEFQRQGIGTMLIHQLIRLALRQGVTRFSTDVLPDNRASLSLLRSTCQLLSATASYGSIHLEIQITQT